MRALTLWQPMAWAISDFTKRIENRPWAPWTSQEGKDKTGITRCMAIHAGARYHADHARQIAEAFSIDVPPRRSVPQGAIVAVCRVIDYVHEDDGPDLGQRTALQGDPWFSGPFGWVLTDVQKLPKPVACSGMLGLWNLPPDVEAAVRVQVKVPR